MAASRFLVAAAACGILVCFAVVNRTQCNGCMMLHESCERCFASMLFFFDFGNGDFPFKLPFRKCFKIVVFWLWRRDPVLELQIAAICGAVVRDSILFCYAVSADRIGMAASRFFAAAAACAMFFPNLGCDVTDQMVPLVEVTSFGMAARPEHVHVTDLTTPDLNKFYRQVRHLLMPRLLSMKAGTRKTGSWWLKIKDPWEMQKHFYKRIQSILPTC